MKNHRFNLAFICIISFLPLISFAQNVGIGISSPTARLFVNGNPASTSTVLFATNNFVGASPVIAIEGYSIPNPGFGTGVSGTGGYAGVAGMAYNAFYSGVSVGVLGQALGEGGTHIGIYGQAIGGTTNWAGFFEGNGHFTGKLSIGTYGHVEKLVVTGDNNSETNIAAFYPNNGDDGIGIGFDEIRKIGVSANGNLNINAKGTGNLLLQNTSTGNVGIATLSPNSALHVHDPFNLGPQITLSAPSGGIPGIAFRPYQGSADWVTAPQALITATDNNYSANINFSTKIQGAIGNELAQRMIIQNDGNVGIGIINPGDKLVVFNGTSTGTYTATGWMHSSDSRLKTDIKPLESSLEKILNLQGVSYNWNATPTENNQIGFIAQDVEKIFPEVISIDKEGNYSMAPQNLTAPIVEAIKEQQEQIRSMEKAIKKLESIIENMQTTIVFLQNENAALNSEHQ